MSNEELLKLLAQRFDHEEECWNYSNAKAMSKGGPDMGDFEEHVNSLSTFEALRLLFQGF